MSAAFRAFLSRREADGAHDEESDAVLRRAVDEQLQRAREAWPSFAVADAELGAALAERLHRAGAHGAGAVADRLRRLHGDDLYFVLACAAGEPTALAVFERTHLSDVRSSLRRRGFPASTVDEALQVLRTTHLVAGIHGSPRILEFGARGQLRGWLRVVAARLAIRLGRSDQRDVPLEPSDHGDAAGDLELALLKRQYGATFQEALRVALAALPVADRLLLKQRFALQMTIVELGALQGVHHSTISRRVADARERLVKATRAGMMEQLRADAVEVSSILRLIQSEMDLSLSTHGAKPSAG